MTPLSQSKAATAVVVSATSSRYLVLPLPAVIPILTLILELALVLVLELGLVLLVGDFVMASVRDHRLLRYCNRDRSASDLLIGKSCGRPPQQSTVSNQPFKQENSKFIFVFVLLYSCRYRRWRQRYFHHCHCLESFCY
jgi:hypothetical protein